MIRCLHLTLSITFAARQRCYPTWPQSSEPLGLMCLMKHICATSIHPLHRLCPHLPPPYLIPLYHLPPRRPHHHPRLVLPHRPHHRSLSPRYPLPPRRPHHHPLLLPPHRHHHRPLLIHHRITPHPSHHLLSHPLPTSHHQHHRHPRSSRAEHLLTM